MAERYRKGITPIKGPMPCLHCGEPVDPGALSEWGWNENGIEAHTAAGTAPGHQHDPTGKSCLYFVKQKEHDRVVKEFKKNDA